MAAEIEPADTLIPSVLSSEAPPPSLPLTLPPPLDPPKRQRRPSVRLGEIGGESTYESNKTWRFHKDPSFAAKTSKTRPLTNLVNGDSNNNSRPKTKKPTKRARTNWNKFDIILSDAKEEEEEEEEDNQLEDSPEFEAEEEDGSEHQSPLNSLHNNTNNINNNNNNNNAAAETGWGPRRSNEENDAGVREWLIGLGLGRYTPVFEIHEVDVEVLPILTLDDLKDMGIAAVGSRRKLYNAILKLRKGFS